MGDDTLRPDRDGVRTPMQWNGDASAGFSRAPPERLYSHPITDSVYGTAAVNVEAQVRDRSSLLQWMRNMIRLRRQFRVFGRGSIEFLPVANRKILAFVRRWESDTILCVFNLSRHAQPAELDLSAFRDLTPVEMLGYTPFPPIGELPYFLTPGGYGFYWFELRRGA
jgi:maltose alpha-D-glucosyltransferase/alpha-amylase